MAKSNKGRGFILVLSPCISLYILVYYLYLIATINPYRYRSYRFDNETGLYYINSRYYDPEIGRFISMDDTKILMLTQGELLGANLFAYCGNNPVMFIDPDGLYMLPIGIDSEIYAAHMRVNALMGSLKSQIYSPVKEFPFGKFVFLPSTKHPTFMPAYRNLSWLEKIYYDNNGLIAYNVWENQRFLSAMPANPIISFKGKVTSLFGIRRDPITGEIKHHSGIDISASKGTPVYATFGGKVEVKNEGSYGLHIIITRSDGVKFYYAHLYKVVNNINGKTVVKGQLIGYVGSTGRSTGNHLHYEVRIGSTSVNPQPYLPYYIYK